MAQLLTPGKIYDKQGSFPKSDLSKCVGKTIICYGVSLRNSFEVHVQLTPTETNLVLDKIDVLYGKLDHGNYPKVKNFAQGSPLLAYFAQDEGLYRARMLKKLDEIKSRVIFVDYGNVEIIPNDQLMDCPDYLIDYVEGASECILQGFDGEDREEELKFLQEAIVEKDLVARIDEIGENGIRLTILTEQGDLKSLMNAHFKVNPNTEKGYLRAPQSEDEFDGAASSKKKVVENKSYLPSDNDMKSKLVNYGMNNNLMDEKIDQLKVEFGKKLMDKDKEIKFCYEQRAEETKRANNEISILKAKINELKNGLSTATCNGGASSSSKQDPDSLNNSYSEMKSKLENIHHYFLDNRASSAAGGGRALNNSETLLIERNRELDKILKNILEVLSNLLSSFKTEKQDDREKQLATEKELNETKRELAKVKQELDNLRTSRI